MAKMTVEQCEKAKKIVNECVKKFETIREAAIAMHVDPSDLQRWKNGYTKIRVIGVIALARLFKIPPYDLRPDWFDKDIQLIFKKGK